MLLGFPGEVAGAGRAPERNESQRDRHRDGGGRAARAPGSWGSTSAVRGPGGDRGLLASEFLRRCRCSCGVEEVSQAGMAGVVAGDQSVGVGGADPLDSPGAHRL
ncbi:hypothetical protein Ari01nite_44180 [Paractinoplanes rishiriensis]|uniref:Uncharacterized protein n=1 Tax=Paractinoplanes rishiriensis TaxID=1050105 RepID=A0A919MVL6_9ACTN|nr:hypothetical protein Ari01nite_44180 [Actinoplanes rishiriensis]